MSKTTIYIASSWKHQHAVELLTNVLRQHGYTVLSFIENNYGEGHAATKLAPFEEWVNTSAAEQAFKYDTSAACNSDVTIYMGGSGKDAIAEATMCWCHHKTLLGLSSPAEDIGLMRKMFHQWFDRWPDLIEYLCKNHPSK